MPVLSTVLAKALEGALLWGLEKFYHWIKYRHEKKKDDKKTNKSAREFNKATKTISDKIQKGESITDEDIKRTRKTARDLIDRLGNYN